MKQEKLPVKPWALTALAKSVNPRKAWIWYVMQSRGITISGLHKLLGGSPSQEFLSMVISGKRHSRNLEERISTILGMSWNDLFGDGYIGRVA